MTSIAAALMAVACGGSHGAMRTDTPALPYQKPDISEITGIPEEEAPQAAPDSAPAPHPAAESPAATPSSKPAPASVAPAGKASALPKK